MKRLLPLILCFLLPLSAYAADSKITDLTAQTAATTDDILPIVDAPGTTPTTKKITFDNLQKSITAVSSITGILIASSGALTAATSSDIQTAIGANIYQAYDADLTTYAGITPSANAQTLLGETFAQMATSMGALTNGALYEPAISTGATTKYWRGDKTWTNIDLANDVTGNLAITHFASGTGANSSTFWCGDGSWKAPTGGAHDAVTLNANLGNVLVLSTQELSAGASTSNYFYAAPSGGNGTLAMRAIASADIPANLKYNPIQFTFKSYGGELTQNTTCTKYVPYACTITAGHIVSDVSGSVQVEIYTSTTASPSDLSFAKISASAPLTLSTAYQNVDSTLTGWTTSVAAGTWVQAKISSTGNPVSARLIVTLDTTRT